MADGPDWPGESSPTGAAAPAVAASGALLDVADLRAPENLPNTRPRAVRKRLVSGTPAHYPTALAVDQRRQTVSSLYASSPCTTVSMPAISSSFFTRKPTVFCTMKPMTKASTNEYTITETAAIACTSSCVRLPL